MIASLRGKLIFNDINTCIVECAGVGYKCFVTSNTLGRLPQKGEEVFLYTFMSVKEDGIDLFGFFDVAEMECFKMITSVSGVGNKIGLSLLSAFSYDQIALFIVGNDPKSLTAASGVGLKLAQRIILELKDKVSAIPGVDSQTVVADTYCASASSVKEAVQALVALGFTQSEASMAIRKLDSSLSAEQLIKEALKNLTRMV